MASLKTKLEAALYLAFEGTADNLYAGEFGDKVLPCLIVAARRAVQPFKSANGGGPANYLAQLEIIAKYSETNAEAGELLFERCHSITAADGFASGLSADGLIVFGESEPSQIDWSTDDDAIVQTITLTVECSLTTAED